MTSIQGKKIKHLLVILIGIGGLLIAANAFAEEPVLIGAPVPLTGPFASDGELMKMALELAVEETNKKGGLLGRKLKLKFGDVGALEPEKVKAIGERLIGAGVNVVLTGYDDGGVDTHVFGQYDIPYLHSNTNTLCTEPVAKNPEKYWNVFQYSFNNTAYGIDAAKNLFEVPKEIGWTAPNKKVAIIKVDYHYNLNAADEFGDRAKKMGYEVVVDELTQFGIVEWGPILSKIESSKPSFVTFWNCDPMDAARFMKQFSEKFSKRGIDALVYMQFTPSLPEFLELAGKSADGLIWVSAAVEETPKQEAYKKRWISKYKEGPKGVYAYLTRDCFDIWVQAVERAGCIECYKEIARNIREAPFEGLCGLYVFNPIDQSAIPGEYLLPLAWYQIRDGKNLATGPKRLKTAPYKRPPWIKK